LCYKAISFFPYHFDTIWAAAEKFSSDISIHRKFFVKHRNSVLEFFKKAYVNHLDLVKLRKIEFHEPQYFPVSDNRLSEILNAICEMLKQQDADEVWFKGCLGSSPEENLKLFEENVSSYAIEKTIRFIVDRIEMRLQQGAIQGCRLTLTNELGCRIYDLEEHHSCNSNWTQRLTGNLAKKAVRK